jgi:hypothetical protein
VKRLYPLLFISVLIYWGCDEQDTTPPTVTITFPQNNSSVFEIVSITCISSDNEGVEKVELWVNGVTTGLTDNSEPYSFDWNTTTLEDGNYTIIIRSYDTNDNTTDSEPVVLTVDNSLSVPNGGNITSVTYTTTEMTVEWEQSSDGDFKDYKLLYSETESGNKDTIQTYTDKTITSHSITDFDPLIENWFWVQVTDTLGLSSIGTGMTNEIESTPPTQIDTPSVTYDLIEMVITWGQSNDYDFLSYELLYSETQSGEQTSIITITDVNTTSYTITDFNPLEERWYWIRVTDYWNLTTMSNGYMVLDSPPTPSVLYPITYDDGFQISWSQNNNDDFVSYKLYESLSEDMSNWTLVYETNDRTNISFDLTLEVLKYYQIIVEDIWGLQSISNIEIGDYDVELWGNSYSVLNTTELDLSNNQLTGSIPPEIGNLTNLTQLYLYNNQLTGSIPPEIGDMTNLTYSGFYNNQLTGSIPSEIGNLTNLTYLDLWNNELTGSIPPEIGNLTNLVSLSFYNNQLTGSIPPEIGNLTNLRHLYLYNNQLTGEIPESICNLVENNCSISISNNQFCPPYPSCIEDYVGDQDTSDCD